ncbi:membrane bound o-acyl transferase family domain-containing protein [Purpureocillium lavendulum]|uniref:Membrane bound o-acyl transferase family domain-containing protein n=1 Tax=Purpureocillium lavendulum TaxID=1247861 RepID=A0AB34FNK3_9HYPO|nr:membrane bound o-acyl transferase family domain-containing protein [Purpureocillium lavendulum]
MRAFSRSKRRDAADSSSSKSQAARQSMQQSQALLSYYSPAGMLVPSSATSSTSSSAAKTKHSGKRSAAAASSCSYNNVYIQEQQQRQRQQHTTVSNESSSSLAPSDRAPSYEASCCSGTATPDAGARAAPLTIPTSDDADPLSVRLATVGLLAATTRAALALSALNTQPLASTRALEVPAGELKYFRLTTQLLHKHLRRAERRCLDRPDRAALVDVDLVVALLTAAAMTVSELDAHLADVEREIRGDGVILADVCGRHARALARDANRITMLDFVMTKLLSVLQVDSEPEAQRHRREAKETIGDMLQSDIALAARMAHVQDPFGAKATVHPARLEEIASRPPPAYSVPSPDSHDELPDYDHATSKAGRDGSVTIQAQAWSPFSGLTLDDLPSVRLIPVPLMHTELRAGEFYQAAYVDRVDDALEELAEAGPGKRAKLLAQTLGFT